MAAARILLLVAILAFAFPAHAAEHVIQISVDGLSGVLLQGLIQNDTAGDFAHFKRFVDEGATTFNARADYTYTITLPNHTTMLTGRPVSQPAGQPNTVHHGWTSNDEPAAGVTLHNGGNPNLSYIASTFDVAHDAGRSTALFASKTKFVLFDQSYPDEIDLYVNASAASMHQSLLVALAASHLDYAFVHYSTPDDAGHANGWGSAAWVNAVRSVDSQLAEPVRADRVRPGFARTYPGDPHADHGGTGTGHSDATNPANYTVPFLLWGEGVQAGVDLYAINPGRRADPATGRPSYTAAVQPIRNGDGANLALAALGLAPVPGSSINASQNLLTAVPAVCGNGTAELGEQCDDGNAASGDCCSPTCQYDPPGSACNETNVCATSTCNASGVCVAGPPIVPPPDECPEPIPLVPLLSTRP